MDQKHQVIKRFAVEMLGCGCPDEVFHTIETGKADILSVTGQDISRILIGNQLLIYLVPVDGQTDLSEMLPRCIQAGTKERDSKGYNRFRLVLTAEDREFDGAGAAFLFSSLSQGDDRLFLHCIERDDLSELLQHL